VALFSCIYKLHTGTHSTLCIGHCAQSSTPTPLVIVLSSTTRVSWLSSATLYSLRCPTRPILFCPGRQRNYYLNFVSRYYAGRVKRKVWCNGLASVRPFVHLSYPFPNLNRTHSATQRDSPRHHVSRPACISVRVLGGRTYTCIDLTIDITHKKACYRSSLRSCSLIKFDKNSSGDEIANVNFLRRYCTYVLQNTKKENLLRLTN